MLPPRGRGHSIKGRESQICGASKPPSSPSAYRVATADVATRTGCRGGRGLVRLHGVTLARLVCPCVLACVAACQFGAAGGGAGAGGDGDGGTGTTDAAGTSAVDGSPAGDTADEAGSAEGTDGTDGTGGTGGPSTSVDAGTDTAAETDATAGGCVEPIEWFLDEDGDGFGDPLEGTVACEPPSAGHVDIGGDCDDAAPGVHPGVDELCDGIDNDCDEGVDEGSASNLACDDCTFLLSADGSAFFVRCPGPITYTEARVACQVYGPQSDLAVVDDPVDDLALLGLAGGDVWIGISDLAREGHWVWVDDTDAVVGGMHVGYDGWGPGEPNGGAVENCAEYDTNVGGWNDGGCDQDQPYYCRHPA